MLGLLNRRNVRGILDGVADAAFRALPMGSQNPLRILAAPAIDAVSDKLSQVPCDVADLLFLPPVSNCDQSAPDRENPGFGAGEKGKCPTQYTVVVNLSRNGISEQDIERTVTGPIQFIGKAQNLPFTSWVIRAIANGVSSNWATIAPDHVVRVKSITRVDGQADNCGTGSPSQLPGGLTGTDIQAIQNTIRDALNGIPGANGSDPCACFAPDAEFWQNLRKALESLLSGGSGIPGDRDGDGIPDDEDDDDGEEDEEEENENDDSCSNKNQLAKLYLMIKNLYQFLGGKEFGNSRCNPADTDFELNPENLIREYVEKSYNLNVSNNKLSSITSKNTTVKSLPQLLAALLAVSYTRSGQWRFPNQVKESLITGGGLPTGNITLPDEQSYSTWQFDNLLGSIGKFERVIKIQDTDPEQSGNQEKTIYLRNTAEALADMFVLMMENNFQTAAILNASIRTGLEIESIKAESFKNKADLDMIIDYLGFKVKDVRKKMPALFSIIAKDGQNPSEQNIRDRNSIPKFLEQSEIDVVIQEIDQKENLQFDLNQFRKTSGIIQATLANRLRNVGNIGATLFNQTIELAKQLGIIDVDNPATETRDDDFGKLIEELETDFIATPGRTETQKPFGKPINERPRITEIGQTTEDS